MYFQISATVFSMLFVCLLVASEYIFASDLRHLTDRLIGGP